MKNFRSSVATHTLAVDKAGREFGKEAVAMIQHLLKQVPKSDGEWYVCTGMGLCSLSCEIHMEREKDEPDAEPYESTDDFEVGEKLKPNSRYCGEVLVTPQGRRLLLRVQEICEHLANEDHLQGYMPYKVFPNRIEK